MNIIQGPVALYNNLPIRADYYMPSRFDIQNITLGQTTVVTTTEAHNYVVGQQVRLIIPPEFRCRELNNQSAFVIAILSPTQVELDICSLGVTPFVFATSPTSAQILAIGDRNNGLVSQTGRVQQSTAIPGSFINISPR